MRLSICICLFTCSLIFAQPQRRQASPIGVTLALDYLDTYMFRGRVLDPEASYQIDLTLGLGSWSYNIFHHSGSDQLNALIEFEKFEEFTHAIEYTAIRGNAITTTGYRLYNYTGGDVPDTQEISFRIAHQSSWHPAYGVAYDFDAYRGTYFDFSLSKGFPLSRRSRLNFDFGLGLSTGMEEKSNRQGQILEYGPYSEELNHGSVAASYHWSVTNRLSIHADYDYHHAFDDKLKMNSEHNDFWTLGFTLLLP